MFTVGEEADILFAVNSFPVNETSLQLVFWRIICTADWQDRVVSSSSTSGSEIVNMLSENVRVEFSVTPTER